MTATNNNGSVWRGSITFRADLTNLPSLFFIKGRENRGKKKENRKGLARKGEIGKEQSRKETKVLLCAKSRKC